MACYRCHNSVQVGATVWGISRAEYRHSHTHMYRLGCVNCVLGSKWIRKGGVFSPLLISMTNKYIIRNNFRRSVTKMENIFIENQFSVFSQNSTQEKVNRFHPQRTSTWLPTRSVVFLAEKYRWKLNFYNGQTPAAPVAPTLTEGFTPRAHRPPRHPLQCGTGKWHLHRPRSPAAGLGRDGTRDRRATNVTFCPRRSIPFASRSLPLHPLSPLPRSPFLLPCRVPVSPLQRQCWPTTAARQQTPEADFAPRRLNRYHFSSFGWEYKNSRRRRGWDHDEFKYLSPWKLIQAQGKATRNLI